MIRHLLDLGDAGGDAIAAMINDAIDRKAARKDMPKGMTDADRPLDGRVLAMIFEKNSTRTRVSFDMAMRQLGGTSLVMDAASTQLGRGETIADTARVLSRMVDAIMIRTDDHAKAEEMARHATVPVINGLTDRSHPCQIVADLLTIVERRKALPGLEVAWLGDGNNVLHSILEAAGLMKFNVRVATPAGYEPRCGLRERSARGRSTCHADPRCRCGGIGCRCGDNRHLGFDGAGSRRRETGGNGSLSGQCCADGVGPSPMQCSCIVCPLISARK